MLLVFLILSQFVGKTQDSVIVCEEKYLPFEITLNFLNDTINFVHSQIGDNIYLCSKRNSSEKWFAKYTKRHIQGKEYFDVEFYNKYGNFFSKAYQDYDNLSIFFPHQKFTSSFMVKNRRLNLNAVSYHNSTGNSGMNISADQPGFKNNARTGRFFYTYDNHRLLAKGIYSGEYLKIDTSENGKELIFYNNLGIELQKIQNTPAAIDSLKKIYAIYKFDFSFPLLAEFREGWWEFGNYDGTPDRKILYQNGKEMKTIIN